VLNGCGKPWRGEWSALKAAIRGVNAAGNRGRPADEPGVGTSADAERLDQEILHASSCKVPRAVSRARSDTMRLLSIGAMLNRPEFKLERTVHQCFAFG
jgi:hypothetical protein